MQEPYKDFLPRRERGLASATLSQPSGECLEMASLGAVISTYGTSHSVLILHGVQVTTDLPSNLHPGLLLIYILFGLSPEAAVLGVWGVGGFCQDWTCREWIRNEDRGLGEDGASRGRIYNYDGFTLMCGRDHHNTVRQVSCPLKEE